MQNIRVEAASEQSTMKALVLADNLPLSEAIDRFASNEGQHCIFLVDKSDRLSAVVNNRELLEWARLAFDLVPGDLPLPVGKVRRLISAKFIRDLALPNSKEMTVKLDDLLVDALKKMSQYDLEDIAVIDSDGRVVNDLRLSEVLSLSLQIARKET